MNTTAQTPPAAIMPGLREDAHGWQLEAVALDTLAARFGTPLHVYSLAALEKHFAEWKKALDGKNASICYAVKANSNLAILSVFARLGAGFDIVSGGELARVLAAGGEAGKTVFSGVGKTAAEIRTALKAGIACLNVESAAELGRIEAIAGELGVVAPVALRVNPDVDANTHPYISTGLRDNKFGIAIADAPALCKRIAHSPQLAMRGIACHIGSQLLDSAPLLDAARRLLALADALAADGITLEHIDLGGGLGIRYQQENPPPVADYLAPVLALFQARSERLVFEPGRALVGNAGLLLCTVQYIKPCASKNFVIVDAAMNDYLRPALYDGWTHVLAVRPSPAATRLQADIVGPVCESADFLARDRQINTAAGDILALLSTGAYGMSMSSNYNSRPRAAEVIVDGSKVHLARAREEISALFANEYCLPPPAK